MAYAQIEFEFWSNPKVLYVGKDAALLYIAGCGYCSQHLTDGFIADGSVHFIANMAWQRSYKKLVNSLVESGLWKKVDGGYEINDYLKHNKSKAEVVEYRDKKSRAGKASAKARDEQNSQQNDGTCSTGVGTGVGTGVDDSVEQAFNYDYDYDYKDKRSSSSNSNLSGDGSKKSAAAAEAPDFDPGRVYRQVTGQFTIPSSETPKVLPALFAFRDNGMSEDEMIEFLKPYFQEWTNRRGKNGAFYSKSNCTWLYDWAVAKQIPAQTVSEEKPKTVTKYNHLGEPIEVPL